jgi:hypothetical protein
MTAESERLQAEQEAFGKVFANLGEIEGKLQEEYAGMHQQMVDSMREKVKNQYKSGKGINDIEFQKELGQGLGRFKAGMANADNIIKEIDRQVKGLNDNPFIDYASKNKAVNEMMAMARNPDVLISKNPIDFSTITNKYINDDLVFQDTWQKQPTLGETQVLFNNERGDQMSRNLVMNDLIDTQNPFDENGRPNIKLTTERAAEILENNPMLQASTNRARQKKYPNDPYDVGMTKALYDGFMKVAPLNQKTTVRKSAEELNRERQQQANQNEMLSMRRQEFNRGKEEEEETYNLYEGFVEGIKTGDSAILGKFQVPGKGIKFSWVKGGDVAASRAKKVIDEQAPEYTFDEWKDIEKEDRGKAMSAVGAKPDTYWFGAEDKASKVSYDRYVNAKKEAVKKAQEEAKSTAADNVVGVLVSEREGTGANAKWRQTPLLWEDDPSMIPNVFEQMDNARKQIKGDGGAVLPVPDLGSESEEDPFDLTGDF